jgi:hypothetical protein
LADKSQRLLIDALTRAAADPDGLPMYAKKGSMGEALFPQTVAARNVAERCQQQGYLEVRGEQAVLTSHGQKHLVETVDSKQLLEDFLRVLERRQDEIDTIASTLDRLRKSVDGMQNTLACVLPKPVNAKPEPNYDVAECIFELVLQWRRTGNQQDCPLPQLYAGLANPKPSIGQFHDALRTLHRQGKIACHPWTGPLYTLPEPAFALMVGHEISYYVNTPA